ncbi:uncharacterized protein CTRU02_206409 [Colletotrichum truncatum]|uniref:Uncharacterized protein n=1 Tax=Colletotrichum truncatum TaxID=5467 RepID=A0ACC3Z6W3_COLTU
MVFNRQLKIIPGKTYRFEAYGWSTNPKAANGLHLYVLPNEDSTTNDESMFFTVNQWEKRSLTFKATSSFTKIMLGLNGNATGTIAEGTNQLYIDDVTLIQLD